MAETTVTVGPSKDYATLSAAMASEDGYNCVTSDGMLYFDCHDFEDTAGVAFGSIFSTESTTDTTRCWKVRAIDKHSGSFRTVGPDPLKRYRSQSWCCDRCGAPQS